MAEDNGISRRDFFKRFIPGKAYDAEEEYEPLAYEHIEGKNMIAVIQGRYCLVYQDIPCTKCSDHCPVPGAIELQDGFPIVISDICTGCGACKDVCPSSADAIMMIESPC